MLFNKIILNDEVHTVEYLQQKYQNQTTLKGNEEGYKNEKRGQILKTQITGGSKASG